MKKRKNDKKQKKTMLLLLILLGVSVGYALLSTTLKINGTASIKGNTWDVHWEHVVPNQQSTITAETPTISNDENTVKQVTIVNEEEVETDATLPSYILYSVVYDGTNTAPAEGDLLGAHSSKTYKVRIEYDPLATTVPENDLVYRITDEFDYEQTKEVDIQGLLANIEADPDSYRNPEQSVANKDIGVDKYGNVINLDWWVDKGSFEGTKIYFINSNTEEITIGPDDGTCAQDVCDCYYTGATSSANVVNGEWKLTLPEYIYDDATSKFYPVTKISHIFAGGSYDGSEDYSDDVEYTLPELSELLPETVTTIGQNTFAYLNFETVTIPKQIKVIGEGAFFSAFDDNGSNNKLIFEAGSELERIESVDSVYGAFEYCNLTGNLVLPQTVSYIGRGAFEGNNLTSVTFSSTATVNPNAFDSSVVINHQY